MDSRNIELAELLVTHSMAVTPGDKVLIESFGSRTFELCEALIDCVHRHGGVPFVRLYENRIRRALLLTASEEQLALQGESEAAFMEQMDCYVGVRGFENVLETADVPGDNMALHGKHLVHKVHMDIRVPKTRWVVLRYPSPTFAQSARMSTAAFEDFFYRACLTDYKAMAKNAEPLARRMTEAETVHISGPGTDLHFSIAGIPAIACAGDRNIPDGECFTAPVRDSINGTLAYNTPTLYDGHFFDNIKLEFENGRISRATCGAGDESVLNEILDRDDGARHIGEFAIAFNNEIREPMLDILFDEKMAGSFHFTPGDAYEIADNGNRSVIHWDMVCRQLEEHGGGTISFDGELIRQDGIFVPEDLRALNP